MPVLTSQQTGGIMNIFNEFQFWGFLWAGLKVTIEVSAIAFVCAVVVGLVMAAIRLSRFWPLRFVGALYVDFFRSTPLFSQLMWFFFALPIITGFSFDALTAGIIALSLYEGSFYAEVFRAGILALPQGQWEAGYAQGMTGFQVVRRIILPQAVWKMMPPATSSTVTLVKDSSLVSLIGVSDLMLQTDQLASVSVHPMQVITFAGLMYLVLTYPLTLLSNFLYRQSLAHL